MVQLIEDCMEKPPEGRPTARQAYDIIKECFASPEALQARRPRTPQARGGGHGPVHGFPARGSACQGLCGLQNAGLLQASSSLG